MPDHYPPDLMGDDLRASLVRQLVDFWRQARPTIPENVRQQMAQEAAAFARSALGEVEELRQMAAPAPQGDE